MRFSDLQDLLSGVCPPNSCSDICSVGRMPKNRGDIATELVALEDLLEVPWLLT